MSNADTKPTTRVAADEFIPLSRAVDLLVEFINAVSPLVSRGRAEAELLTAFEREIRLTDRQGNPIPRAGLGAFCIAGDQLLSPDPADPFYYLPLVSVRDFLVWLFDYGPRLDFVPESVRVARAARADETAPRSARITQWQHDCAKRIMTALDRGEAPPSDAAEWKRARPLGVPRKRQRDWYRFVRDQFTEERDAYLERANRHLAKTSPSGGEAASSPPEEGEAAKISITRIR